MCIRDRTNTVTGPDFNSAWTITADDAGTINPGVGTTVLTRIQSFTGGTGNDSFTFNGVFQLTGTTGVDGGGGSNTLTAPNVNNSWTVTGNNEGTLENTTYPSPNLFSFTNFPNIIGESNTDDFIFDGAFQLTGTTGLDGGSGSNTLTAPNVNNSWTVTGNNTGTITSIGAPGATNLSLIHISEPTRPY